MRWALLVVVLAGCIESQLVTCPDDELCPVGTVCDTTHGGCITPDQATACVGLTDHTACRAGTVIGYCLDQICVDPGCGNHVIDPGELCDDGNRVDGDGCNATCTSEERCGDGAIDPRLGEECDDGNLLSHDGCDSRCLTETATWSVDPIGPAFAFPEATVYDPQLGKIVMFTDGNIWAWDGTRWTLVASDGPRIPGNYNVVYDTARSRLVVVAPQLQMGTVILPAPRNQIYEWDGTTWTMAIASNPPNVQTFVATYDGVRNVIVGFGVMATGAAVGATYDAATHAWTTTPAPNGVANISYIAMAFDENRGRAVVLGSLNGSSVTAEWNGSTWGSVATATAATAGWSLFYDPSIAKVVAVGVQGLSGPTPVQSWNGAAWTSLPSVDQKRFHPSVAYDATRNVRFVFGGDQSSGYTDAVTEGSGSTWTPIARTAAPPSVDNTCAFDENRARLVCVGSGNSGDETWTYNGTWSLLGSLGELVFYVTYDPVREGVVTITPGLLSVLGDSGWQSASLPSVGDIVIALTFDPSTSDLVITSEMSNGASPMTVRIDPQNQVQSFSSPELTSLAFDARNDALVGTTGTDTLQLAGQTWVPIVGPGSGYRALANARRGSVELVGLPHDVERVGVEWLDLAPAPVTLSGSAVFAESTGDLYELGVDGISRFMLRRHWDSATPFEDCSGSNDVDGDGLAGCDDPDCWPQCHACPPLTSCP